MGLWLVWGLERVCSGWGLRVDLGLVKGGFLGLCVGLVVGLRWALS